MNDRDYRQRIKAAEDEYNNNPNSTTADNYVKISKEAEKNFPGKFTHNVTKSNTAAAAVAAAEAEATGYYDPSPGPNVPEIRKNYEPSGPTSSNPSGHGTAAEELKNLEKSIGLLGVAINNKKTNNNKKIETFIQNFNTQKTMVMEVINEFKQKHTNLITTHDSLQTKHETLADTNNKLQSDHEILANNNQILTNENKGIANKLYTANGKVTEIMRTLSVDENAIDKLANPVSDIINTILSIFKAGGGRKRTKKHMRKSHRGRGKHGKKGGSKKHTNTKKRSHTKRHRKR